MTDASVSTNQSCAIFKAAFVSSLEGEPDGRRIHLRDGERLTIHPGGSFEILTQSGWDLYYTPRGTEIFGPAIVTAQNQNGGSRGIFASAWKTERAEGKQEMNAAYVTLILSLLCCTTNILWPAAAVLFVAWMILLSSGVRKTMSFHTIMQDDLEERVKLHTVPTAA